MFVFKNVISESHTLQDCVSLANFSFKEAICVVSAT